MTTLLTLKATTTKRQLILAAYLDMGKLAGKAWEHIDKAANLMTVREARALALAAAKVAKVCGEPTALVHLNA